MWNGKMKALTFTFDDGCIEDIRLAETFDKYGLKCSFNIIGSKLIREERLRTNDRISIEKMREIYKNHEVVMHTYSHPFLPDLTRECIEYEIKADYARLHAELGVDPVGIAYPFGAYNDTVLEVLRELGVKYGRSAKYTNTFDPPTKDEFLNWKFTCHHQTPRLFELADTFLALKPDCPQLFCVMGHSYEFKTEADWEKFERFCQLMAGRDDIFYGTNAECILGE